MLYKFRGILIMLLGTAACLLVLSSCAPISVPERTAADFFTAYFNAEPDNLFRLAYFSADSRGDVDSKKKALIAWSKLSKDGCERNGGIRRIRIRLGNSPALLREGEKLPAGVDVTFKNGDKQLLNTTLININGEWKILF